MESILGPVLFQIFIDYSEDEIKNIVCKFANVLLQVHSDVEQQILQEDLNKLTEWTDKWQMSFNTKKCKVCRWEGLIKGLSTLLYVRTSIQSTVRKT